MKILVGVLIILILVAALFAFLKPKASGTKTNEAIQNEESSAEEPEAIDIVLSKEQIAKHNSEKDCWLYIDDSVYNVSNFIGYHSGGSDKILPYCGSDATGAFKSRIHSAETKMFLERLNLGKIDEKVPNKKIIETQNDDFLVP